MSSSVIRTANLQFHCEPRKLSNWKRLATAAESSDAHPIRAPSASCGELVGSFRRRGGGRRAGLFGRQLGDDGLSQSGGSGGFCCRPRGAVASCVLFLRGAPL